MRNAAQVGHLAINTEGNRRLMLPTTKIKVEGMEFTVLVDTGANTSFLQKNWTKQSAIEICKSQGTYQIQKAMGQEETGKQINPNKCRNSQV